MKTKKMRLQFSAACLALAVTILCGTALRGEPAVAAFSGTDSYIGLGAPAALQLGNNQPFTVEGWMYMRSIESANMLLSKNEAKVGNGSPYTFFMGFRDYYDRPELQMLIHSPAAGYKTVLMSYVPYRWYHIAFSFNGTTVSMYVDGALKSTAAFSYVDVPTHNIYIGGYASDDLDGYKSDLRMWNVARTQTEIQDNMYHRLAGTESGLIGYWPMDDGTGDTAGDLTSNVTTGALVNATWALRPDLPVSEADDLFVAWSPFTVADRATGSKDFTGSNEVNVVAFPIPTGYDRYQITESGDIGSLGSWTATSTPPSVVSFTRPTTDTNLLLYAWFTNSTGSVALRRSGTMMRYTTAAPVPSVHASLTRETAGFTVQITGWELDNGSTGGTTGSGESIPIHAYEAVLESGSWGDFTPTAPYVTLTNQPGSYTLKLRVINAAGNVANANCPVTIVTATAAPADGDRYVAVGNLFATSPYATWTTAAASIQVAVTASAVTDTIRVAPGVYTATATPVVTIAGNRTLRGWGSLEAVIIDGEMTRQGMSLTGPATVDGFTITRGISAGYGGGVRVEVMAASAVLRNCLIEDCHSTYGGTGRGGGGIWAYGTAGSAAYTAIVENVTIRNCTQAGSQNNGGGGVYLRDCPARIENCTIVSNWVYGTQANGGGFFINNGAGGRTIIRNTLIAGNTAPSTGGGIHLSSPTLIENCTFRGNAGGGAYIITTTNVMIRNSQFYDNHTINYGGAVGFVNAGAGGVLENCTIVSNRSDQNTSGGVHYYNTNPNPGAIRNCIVYENYKGTALNNIVNYKSYMEVSYTCNYPVWPTGTGNTAALPQFVNFAGRDFRLQPTSPCRNAGLNQDWMVGARDLDGKPRLDAMTGIVDMGCYEFVAAGTILTIR